MNYNNFIEKYKSKLKDIPNNIEYENLYNDIEKICKKTIIDKKYPLNYLNGTTEFVLAYMLSTFSISEMMNNLNENKVNMIATKLLLSSPKRNTVLSDAEKYLTKRVNSIVGIFDINEKSENVVKNIYDNLIFNGRNDADILNKKCDDEIYTILADGYANCKFDNDFSTFRSIIANKTSSCFARNKLEIIRRDGNAAYKNISYRFYDNSSFQKFISFKIACSLYMSGFNSKNINDININNKIQDYINYEMMKYNSTLPKNKNSIQKYIDLPKKEKRKIKDEMKKKVIIFAIVFGAIATENIIYNATHNTHKKEEPPKKIEEVSSKYIPGSYWDKIYEEHNMEVRERK